MTKVVVINFMRLPFNNRFLKDSERATLNKILIDNEQIIGFWAIDHEISRLETAARIMKTHQIKVPAELELKIEHLRKLVKKKKRPEPEEICLDFILQVGRCDVAEIEEEIAGQYHQLKDILVDLWLYNHSLATYATP